MKNWKKIFIIISILVFSFSSAYLVLILKAKGIIAGRLSEALGRRVDIGQIDIKPPLNLEVFDFNVEGLARIGYIYVSPSIPYLLTGRLALNKVRIVNPQISCERRLVPLSSAQKPKQEPEIDKTAEKTAAAAEGKEESPAKPAENGFKLIIKSLKIRSGEVTFIDHTADSREVTVIVKNIDVNLRNLYTYPVDNDASFDFSGRLPWQSGEPDGRIYLYGRMNSYKKDVSADLSIEDIDAIAFYPYYSTWVDLEKARIEKAKLNFSSKITGENNDLSAQCHLELADIVRKARPPEEPQQKAERLTDAVLDMFKAMNQGKVVLDFTLHTKMDHPKFGFEDIKSAFEGKLMQARTNAGLRAQDMLLWPGKLLQGGIKSGSDLTKATVDGMVALGNGVKKFFEEAMNKQTPEKQ